MNDLNITDYKHILDFYKIPLPKSKRMIRLEAERIIASKLCKCIKKFDNKDESRSIGICTKTIVNRKGFSRGKFTCKKKQKIKLYKKNKTRKV